MTSTSTCWDVPGEIRGVSRGPVRSARYGSTTVRVAAARLLSSSLFSDVVVDVQHQLKLVNARACATNSAEKVIERAFSSRRNRLASGRSRPLACVSLDTVHQNGSVDVVVRPHPSQRWRTAP